MVQQTDALAEHNGNHANDEFIEQARMQALLDHAGPHEDDILASRRSSRLLHGVLDTGGDKRVRRLTRWHRAGDVVSHDEQLFVTS